MPCLERSRHILTLHQKQKFLQIVVTSSHNEADKYFLNEQKSIIEVMTFIDIIYMKHKR